MENYYTISDFTQYLITKYEIEENKNNFRAVRTKVVRTIEDLKINLVKKEQIFLISKADCLTVEYKIRKYLIKRSSMTEERKERYFKHIKEYYEGQEAYQKYEDELASMSQDEQYEKMKQDELGRIDPISEDQITRAMITALFNLFFTPIDIEQWNKDNIQLHSAYNLSSKAQDITDIETFSAIERFINPHLYYTQKREKPLI